MVQTGEVGAARRGCEMRRGTVGEADAGRHVSIGSATAGEVQKPVRAGRLEGDIRGLHRPAVTGHAGNMPDRPSRTMEELIRRVQRVAADRPDPLHVLSQMISLIGESDVDPYAILGVLIEGAAHTLGRHIPPRTAGGYGDYFGGTDGRPPQGAQDRGRRPVNRRRGIVCRRPRRRAIVWATSVQPSVLGRLLSRRLVLGRSVPGRLVLG